MFFNIPDKSESRAEHILKQVKFLLSSRLARARNVLKDTTLRQIYEWSVPLNRTVLGKRGTKGTSGAILAVELLLEELPPPNPGRVMIPGLTTISDWLARAKKITKERRLSHRTGAKGGWK